MVYAWKGAGEAISPGWKPPAVSAGYLRSAKNKTFKLTFGYRAEHGIL
jgi:hypothetical protein